MVPQEDLQETFDRIWKEIRGAKLYAGQPRGEGSAQGVSLAQQALELAADLGSERFLVESWLMLGYTLTANEDFGKPYLITSSPSNILNRPDTTVARQKTRTGTW